MGGKQYYVYILASGVHGTLYIGMTSNLLQRIYDHKIGKYDGFTKKYHVNRLVYYEIIDDASSAVSRERQTKEWQRQWKINLINKFNPEWKDLYPELIRLCS